MNSIENIVEYFEKHNVTSSIHKQIFLFLISGGICFIADLSILVFLVEILKMDVIISNCISVIFTIFLAYFLNVKFIFQNGKFGIKKEISLFYIFSGISFVLDVLFLYLLVEYIFMWYVLAKIIVSLIVATFNFSTRKWFIFSN
jgi:putative flippase GtrA